MSEILAGKTTKQKKNLPQVVVRMGESAIVQRDKLYVMPNRNEWLIIKDGRTRAMGKYATKAGALGAARMELKSGKIHHVIVYDHNGIITKEIIA